MAENQAWTAQFVRQQRAEPERRRIEPARELGHERDAARLHQLTATLQFAGRARQGQRAVDRLSRRADGTERMEAEPLGGQQVDDIDVGSFHQRPDASDRRAADLSGLDLRPPRDLIVHRDNLEAVAHLQQRGLVASLPEPSQTDDADP